ncbi:hypothetical protein [Thermococcus barophilus]|uniref:HEPN domain-containing protein n=1 Tax=Thermococcus barophilus (strain DSM 11836 / MP) TaxID=391623 RepID=F0LJ94_THEBM|nr:hypothetical protein [Thermococcus barophilus]ADT84616.1 hypothetical protein TERMP_01641 [Thermococcus barophilus MP]
MEEEMLRKIDEYIKSGDEYFKEGNYRLAFRSYLEAMYSISVYIIYKDLGLLMPPGPALGMMKTRYPDVYGLIEKYIPYETRISGIDEELVRIIKSDVEKVYRELIR